MRKAADILYLLSTYAIKGQFVEKALIYSQSGHHLFPQDTRLLETYVFSLLLNGNYEKAEDVLKSTDIRSQNLDFLRLRLSMILKKTTEEKTRLARMYLST